MPIETLHPIDDGQVVREIVHGGDTPREFVLYPDDFSVKTAQRLERSRFVPKLLAAMLDEGMPVDRDFLDTSMVVEDFSDAA